MKWIGLRLLRRDLILLGGFTRRLLGQRDTTLGYRTVTNWNEHNYYNNIKQRNNTIRSLGGLYTCFLLFTVVYSNPISLSTFHKIVCPPKNNSTLNTASNLVMVGYSLQLQNSWTVLRIVATSKSSIQILFLLFTYLLLTQDNIQHFYKTQLLPLSSSIHYQKPWTCSAGS